MKARRKPRRQPRRQCFAYRRQPPPSKTPGANFWFLLLKLLMATSTDKQESHAQLDFPNPVTPPATTAPPPSPRIPTAKVLAAGIDTWSLCWYDRPPTSLSLSLRALATVPAGRAYLVPTRVADHRIGWFPDHGLIFAEGHPAGHDLCRPSDAVAASDRLIQAASNLGIQTLDSSTAIVRRLDVAVDVFIASPSIGLVFLERLGREAYGSGKVVTYRQHHCVQTVILKTNAGRSQARIYDKGAAHGTERPGQLLRLEAQWRFGNGSRPPLETLDAFTLRHRFNSRFTPVRASTTAFQLDGFSDLADRFRDAVSSGRLSPSRARSLAGYLLLMSAGTNQGASRTKCELARECRALGIAFPTLTSTATSHFDASSLLDECMSITTWS
jgi:hypothetical protein